MSIGSQPELCYTIEKRRDVLCVQAALPMKPLAMASIESEWVTPAAMVWKAVPSIGSDLPVLRSESQDPETI